MQYVKKENRKKPTQPIGITEEELYQYAELYAKPVYDYSLNVLKEEFEAKYNIEYGCFMLSYYYDKYDSYEIAAAAYHSGMGQVDSWISDGTIDADYFDADDIPGSKTSHYIKKVMRCYSAYTNLYNS